jgi:hypothetical protein
MLVFGVDVLDAGVRGLHAFMAAGWLLFDFVVYWLHFDVKNPAVPLANRIERARIMHGIDTIVGLIFLAMLPTGIVLCLITDTKLFTTAWLNWKHVLYGIVIIDALYLIPISGTALRNLNAIKSGAPNVDELNAQIAGNMNKAMPAVFLVWALVFVISALSMLNLKSPKGQEYIFRKLPHEQVQR